MTRGRLPGGGGSSVVGKRETRLYEPEERLHRPHVRVQKRADVNDQNDQSKTNKELNKCFATTVAGENSLMVERSLAKAEVEGSSPSFRSWLRRLVVTSYLSGGLLLLVTFFACGTYSLKMACMWSRMLSISIVGALSAYPSFMPPYRLVPLDLRKESYFVPLASKSRENRGPGIAGPSKYGDYCFHCSTIECKSRSLNCRGAALRKGIPTSISIRAKVRIKLFVSLRSCRIFKRVGRLVSPGKPLLSGLHQVIECPTIRMRMGQGEVRDETLVDLRQSGASGGMAAVLCRHFGFPTDFALGVNHPDLESASRSSTRGPNSFSR
ncbi:hypothetical protein LWI28_008371 [Acer negundo]|uniref:Uncharacterized protein n=1 Tax=Acer negundo TaxID=4023 RepID=A0AAD5J7D0_ACENE|nr:hypothetical protein LWI28_008371 [Acer negundo]